MRVLTALVVLTVGLGCTGDPPDGSARRPFPVGLAVALDAGWSLEVTEVAEILRHTDPGRPAKPSDSLVVAVSLEMAYLGRGGGFAMQALNPLTAVGPSKRLYRYYRGHCTDDLLWQLEPLATGGRTSGQVCFIVDPSDAEDLVMFLDAPPGQGNRNFFSLR